MCYQGLHMSVKCNVFKSLMHQILNTIKTVHSDRADCWAYEFVCLSDSFGNWDDKVDCRPDIYSHRMYRQLPAKRKKKKS